MSETKLYFAGGMYINEADLKDVSNYRARDLPKQFGAVSPSNALPYVFVDRMEAHRAYNLMKHHSSLYATTDFIKAHVVDGFGKPDSPMTVALPEQVSEHLKKAALLLNYEVS